MNGSRRNRRICNHSVLAAASLPPSFVLGETAVATMPRDRYAGLAVMGIGGILITPGLFLDPSKLTFQIGSVLCCFGVLQSLLAERVQSRKPLSLPSFAPHALAAGCVLYFIYGILQLYWRSLPFAILVIALAFAFQYAITQLASRHWDNSYRRSSQSE